MRLSGSSLSAAVSAPHKISIPEGVFRFTPRRRWFCLRVLCTSENLSATTASSQSASRFGDLVSETQRGTESLSFEVRSPSSSPSLIRRPVLSLSDQAFLLIAVVGCTTSVAVPTLFAMQKAATSLSKLADTACEELPSTTAAIRLSGMEISDLTLELSDLSQEIADGVNKSAQAVQAVEAGVRQIGSVARQQTMAMIQERASLPIISLQPVMAGAAKKTSRAVGRAAKTFLNIISPSEHGPANEYERSTDVKES